MRSPNITETTHIKPAFFYEKALFIYTVTIHIYGTIHSYGTIHIYITIHTYTIIHTYNTIHTYTFIHTYNTIHTYRQIFIKELISGPVCNLSQNIKRIFLKFAPKFTNPQNRHFFSAHTRKFKSKSKNHVFQPSSTIKFINNLF